MSNTPEEPQEEPQEDAVESLEELKSEISSDSAMLTKALGGWTGMVDSGLPSIAFIVTYLGFNHNLALALKIALATAVVLAVIRLLQKKSLQQVLSGLLGVGISWYITKHTGQAKNFYLPGILTNLAYGAVCLISILLRAPLLGFLVSTMRGQDPTSWRRDAALKAQYSTVTWLWVLIFGLRVAIMWPLYLAGQLAALGVLKILLGWPLYLLGIFITYRIIRDKSGSPSKDASA